MAGRYWSWRKGTMGRPGSQRPIGDAKARPILCGSQEPRANRVASGYWPTDRDICVDPRGPRHTGKCTGSTGRKWQRRRRL